MIPSESRISRRREAARSQVPGAPIRACLAEEGLAAGPVADDVDGVQVARVAGGVEDPVAALRRAFPGPPAVLLVERRRLRGELVLEPVAVLDERRDSRGAVRLGLAGIGVTLSDVRGHGRLPSVSRR